MNLNRCSRTGTVVLVVLLTITSFALPVAAIATTATEIPQSQEVGVDHQGTVTLEDLYEDGTDQFQLQGTTELDAANWQLRYVKLNGDTTRTTFTGSSFETRIAAEDEIEQVKIRITGEAPPIENYTYDPAPSFLFANLSKVVGANENEVGSWETRPFTAESEPARAAIESASVAAARTDDQADDAQVERAIRAYENENFELSADLAADAESTARSSVQSSQRNRILLVGAVGVVAVAGIVGAVFYLRERSGPNDPLS